ncbi:DUF2877 domain-containing protein [Staphylococcus simiae]|uniref:DUF2877 domain-containing protein n=1 Tax=Staphylococcus simiae CCM 7213 = CCUG 51256 TaxID=911238 RepID=G5JLY1_9STAP|nr:DUF2877 domain-containing protein [Staphylococcus simiae]EHJ06810.1 hypothetical protein SS7213T_12502 [Staphylococcus simiae CCM 7213 = CCUG 51256]PNZ13869.1 DUF2877 domain-containing protein [Staphylococcus simiae]SNV59694.1 Protein of uncharacterised function (DUF2877) [Staphylococcus simiae]
MILTARSIGKHAHRILSQHPLLTVHSKFNKGFNVITDNDDLIFIGTDDNGMFPFGITVDQQTRDDILQQIEVGSVMTVKHQTIQFANNIQLRWKVAQHELLLQPEVVRLEQLQQAIAHYDFSDFDDSDFSKARMKQVLKALITDDVAVTSELQFLIGRGQGLTPTGDDILSGILAIHYVTPFIAQHHLDDIAHLLNHQYTTLVSETFLYYAINGEFSSKIIKLLHYPSIETIEQLLQVGSSSGKDTLYGIYLALNMRSEIDNG